MKILLIILAVLVMDARDVERSPPAKPCGCSCKMKRREQTVTVPEENIILIKLQG